jgi:hypothetical protein
VSQSPLSKTKQTLEEQGWKTWIVEVFNHWVGVRQDMFGFIDLVAIKPGLGPNMGIVGVQVTSHAHRADHLKKILSTDSAKTWLMSGGRIWLITWGKHKPRGEKVPRWDMATMELTLSDFAATSSVDGSLSESLELGSCLDTSLSVDNEKRDVPQSPTGVLGVSKPDNRISTYRSSGRRKRTPKSSR